MWPARGCVASPQRQHRRNVSGNRATTREGANGQSALPGTRGRHTSGRRGAPLYAGRGTRPEVRCDRERMWPPVCRIVDEIARHRTIQELANETSHQSSDRVVRRMAASVCATISVPMKLRIMIQLQKIPQGNETVRVLILQLTKFPYAIFSHHRS